MNIYVANLGFSLQDDDLRQLFSSYGTVSSAKIVMDKVSGQSRGFGFVEMPDDQAAAKAIEELNGVMAAGRPIKVNEAKPRENRDNFRSSYGRR
jgi:RNA recognition motif-containing protein